MENKLSIGDRVRIGGHHPWAGHDGQVVRFEPTPWGRKPVVKLDAGRECFVMQPDQARKLKA